MGHSECSPGSSADAGSSSDGGGCSSTDNACSSISSSSTVLLHDAEVSVGDGSTIYCSSVSGTSSSQGLPNHMDDSFVCFSAVGYTPGDDGPGYQMMTDTEIIHEVSNSINPEESFFEVEDEALVEDQNLVSDEQAYDALDISLRWLEARENIDPVH